MIRAAAFVALALVPLSSAIAQDVVMRRPIPSQSGGSQSQMPSNGQDASGSSAGAPGQDALDGDSYAWYALCYGGGPFSECLSFAPDGTLGFPSDQTLCATPQSAAHKALVAEQSLALLGDASALQPAGSLVLPQCSASTTTGHGYSCTQDGTFHCYAVDSQSYSLSYADPSACASPQSPGDFSGVLSYWSLNPPGVDPSNTCRKPSFYGRKDQCELSSPDSSGAMSMKLVQTCFGIDPNTSSVNQADLQSCLSQPQFSLTADQMSTLKSLDLVPPSGGVQIACGNASGYDFEAKVTSDATTANPDGTSSRRIDYAYTCSQGGQTADMVNCTIDLVSFEDFTKQFATDNGYGIETGGSSNDHLWYVIYTFTP